MTVLKYFLILIILVYIYLYFSRKIIIYDFSSIEKYDFKIPKTIIQTYYNKSKIPEKVYTNIKQYAPEYKHIIYDDDECIDFLNKFDNMYPKFYKFNLVKKWKSLRKGAHKADLFRYCYLYHNGGIYLDIKTILIKPINEIFTNDNFLYTCIDIADKNIYQGIIAVYPRHPLIGNLINKFCNVNNIELFFNYLLITSQFADEIRKLTKTKKLYPGKQNISDMNIYLFKENPMPKKECYKKDRYGQCNSIYDEEHNQVIKVRYPDFPW